MKIIPSDIIEMSSPLPKEEVAKRLRENIQPLRKFGFKLSPPVDQKAFEGSLHDNSFQIKKVIRGKNSFLPEINGSFKETANGTTILLVLKLHGFIIVFMAIWLGGVGLAVVGGIYGIITQGAEPVAAIIPILIFSGGVSLVLFGYRSGKEKSISAMKKIVNGKVRTQNLHHNRRL